MIYYGVRFRALNDSERGTAYPRGRDLFACKCALDTLRERVRTRLRQRKQVGAEIEEWEIIGFDSQVLRRVGVIGDARNIRWRKS